LVVARGVQPAKQICVGQFPKQKTGWNSSKKITGSGFSSMLWDPKNPMENWKVLSPKNMRVY